MISNRSRSWAVALALVSASAPAWATSMLLTDVNTMSKTSDAIVRGKVKRLESRWSGDKMRIFTEVEVEVAESLKGEPAQTVKIRQPGGQVGDIAQVVSGLASFQEGEEVVVFLEKRGGQRFQVSGMAQGKFRVERSSDGKAAYAIPDGLGDAQLLDPVTRQPVKADRQTLELATLKTRIRTALSKDATTRDPKTVQPRAPTTKGQ
jgi:hypothetical protein